MEDIPTVRSLVTESDLIAGWITVHRSAMLAESNYFLLNSKYRIPEQSIFLWERSEFTKNMCTK